MFIIIFVVVLATFLYMKIVENNRYWDKRGIPHPKPWPVFGNLASAVLRRRAFTDLSRDLYQAFPEARYIGVYQFLQPSLFIRDPELIKNITVKEFDTFPDHRTFVDPQVDPLWGKNLFSMRAQDGWRDLRATLTPSFTSSKLKTMFVLMKQCSKQFVEHFQGQGGTVEVELKDALTRYTNDVIGTTVFGVTCDSLKDRENEFYLMGKDVSDFTGLGVLRIFGYLVSPWLMKLFNVGMFSKKASAFFRGIIKETVRVREEKQIVRPDMIHLLMEARKGRLKYDVQDELTRSGYAVIYESKMGKTQRTQKIEITDDDITANALIFFLAGFETTSTLMSYVLYELTVNPDIQQKLREEIDATIQACSGEVTYEALLGMKYLDMVVSETLRRRPVMPVIDRKSVKPFTIQPERLGETPLFLETGFMILISIYAIHMDSNYYPNPEKFDPERFSDENKHKIEPFTYLPFGVGPRNCIGSRFALLECKLLIVELLRKFEAVPVKRTQIPLELSKSNPNPVPDGGFWVELKPRSMAF